MRALRSRADAVVIGGGTLRAERLSLGLDAADEGPVPLGVVLSGTGEVPIEGNLIRDRRQRLLVLVSEEADEGTLSRHGSLAEVRRVPGSGSGTVDLKRSLRMLKSEYAVNRLLVEGGPTLNHALIRAGLAQELFLTVAPMLVGTGASGAPTILEGPLARPLGLELLSAYLVSDELFLRYSMRQ
jgi:2,5-diamino-6-(ribosylamino)-4(3H)-pyrimidinone 5'-phosphate reductase